MGNAASRTSEATYPETTAPIDVTPQDFRMEAWAKKTG
jgi:hypothetical protein